MNEGKKPSIDIDEIRQLYETTTSGKWVVRERDGMRTISSRIVLEHGDDPKNILEYDPDNIPPGLRTYDYDCDPYFICDLNDGEYHEYADITEQRANADFIATVHNVFLALLDEIERLRTKD